MVANEPPTITSDDVYFLTHLGQRELAAVGTSLSRSELELLVLIDGKATVSQVQASAGHLAPSEVIKVLDKLLRSEHIALQQFDLGDFFGASALSEWKGEMPSDSAIARGVSTLQQDGYVVRIARRPPSEPKLARDRKLTVMVVEDEQQLAEIMRKVLSLAGFVARVAANCEQIVAAFRQPPLPDLVLLDVMLPDTDGFNVLAKMRQHPMLREVPVIMVTGTATREAVLKGLGGGANGYITKPFHINVLVKAVKTVLGIEPSDQEAVLGSILRAPETAVPGGNAAAAAAPAAPTAPAAPAEPSATVGSRLAQLKQLAQAKQAEQQKPDSQPEIDARVSRAVEKAYRYLKEFTDQLNIVKPSVTVHSCVNADFDPIAGAGETPKQLER
jgi:two-component system OmpR family response regulator